MHARYNLFSGRINPQVIPTISYYPKPMSNILNKLTEMQIDLIPLPELWLNGINDKQN